jgi:uncharacterized membrane protein YuzA (DUF378 family)
MASFNWFDWFTTALVIIGALNLGIIGLGILLDVSSPLTSWNLINILFGAMFNGSLEGIIYSLIGLAGIYEIYVGYKFAVTG